MVRARSGKTVMRRRKRLRKLTKGFRLARHNCVKQAKITLMRAGVFAFRDRRARKRMFRRLWITRVNAACRARGLVADALCITQHSAVTFFRRLARDLREQRKPPLVLLRRGLHLARTQRAVVANARARGCRVVHPDVAFRELAREVRV